MTEAPLRYHGEKVLTSCVWLLAVAVAGDAVLLFQPSFLNPTRVDKLLVPGWANKRVLVEDSQTAHFDIKNCAGGGVLE